MKEFPIIIRKVNYGKYETIRLDLKTNKDIKLKTNRTKSINKYLIDNNYEKYCICSDCALGPSTCPKIADISKKEIEKYPFITDGFQVIDVYENKDDIKYSDSELGDCEYLREVRKNSSKLEKFIVCKCKKYSARNIARKSKK